MEEKSGLATKVKLRFQALGNQVFYGWWIVVLGSLINGIGLGIIYHSVTVFFLPLKRDLGVSSAAVSLLYGAARLEGGFDGPLIGYLVQRFGSRRLIMVGAISAGIGFLVLSTVHDFLTFLLIYVLLISFGNNAGFFHPVTTAINKWFIRKRGLCFSIVTASGNIGGMVMAPTLSYMILNFGWRYGAIFAGSMILLVALPSAWRFKNSPEEMGLLPDGTPPREKRREESVAMPLEAAEVNFTIREALRTLQFWLLMTGISLRLMVTIAMNIHFVPILVWRGMGEAAGAYLVSLTAFTCILSTLVFGWLGDRWNKALLCSLGIVPAMIAMGGLVFSQAEAVLYYFPIGFAITMGTAPLNWALIGDLFGRGSYATVRGVMAVGYGTATFVSPIFAGWVFDHTGSYAAVLITFTIIFLITAIFFALLHRPSRFRA